jgi:chromosome partitioning protein
MKILTIANQKGGVGKSTLAVHMAYAAMEAGKRVLLVDMDKQGSLSLTFTAPTDATPGLIASKLFSSESIDAQPQTISNKLAIIRADNALLAIDKAENQVIRLPGQALRRFEANFDLCVIDTPPLLGIRLMASLAAADYVLTPVSVGLYELAGVADLMQTIHVIRTQGFNPRLKHIGILPMKVNSRSTEAKNALASLQNKYGPIILSQALAERAAVRKAIAQRRPVWTNIRGEGHLTAANEWRAACAAILDRLNK